MPEESDNVIRYGGAVVKLYPRANGMVSLSWSEGGSPRRTTRKDLPKAEAWARKKVRELHAATGSQWVTPASADRLAWLEAIAGGPEHVGKLLTVLESAKGILGADLMELEKAAAWYIKHGPPAVHHRTLKEAVEGFLLEYKAHHPRTTTGPLKSELLSFVATHGEEDLLTISHTALGAHVRRGDVEKRTINNRINHWVTFFNRAEEVGWWPEGKKSPAHKLIRPREDDEAPEIFAPEIAEKILLLVLKEQPQHLSFVLIAGWLGCRPSECQRLEKAAFNFETLYLHVSAKVAGKTGRERWIPIPPALAPLLQQCFAADESGQLGWKSQGGRKANTKRACRRNAREHVSVLVREAGIIETWHHDVLRHSFITYRLVEVQNIDQVAEEAGNSPREIRNSYKRPIPPGEAEKWRKLLELPALASPGFLVAPPGKTP